MSDPTPDCPIAPPRIRIRNVHHQFGERTVIDRLDLEIDPGQCLVILGPSGCGKSTLLRLIAGLITPTQGEVLLEPEGSGLGFVFQDASLLPWRTTLENVRLPLELDGCPKDVAHQECIDLLKDVGLGDFIDHYPDALSGGMRMRVSIARALAGAPRLLLLDEPFAALDEVTRQRLDSHLGRLVRERGITTLFVTHSISEAVTLADRIVVLSAPQGRIVLEERVHHDPDRDLQAPERLALMNRLSSILLNEGGA